MSTSRHTSRSDPPGLRGFVELDADAAEQVAWALHVHIRALRSRGLVVSPAVEALRDAALRASRNGQNGSAASIRRGPVHASSEWLDTADVAGLVGVSESTVRRWLRTDLLASAKLGRVRRIHRADLERFLTQRKGTPDA